MGYAVLTVIFLSCTYSMVNTVYRVNEDKLEVGNQAEQAKLECESTLPRNQHCEIIIKAIPIEE